MKYKAMTKYKWCGHRHHTIDAAQKCADACNRNRLFRSDPKFFVYTDEPKPRRVQ